MGRLRRAFVVVAFGLAISSGCANLDGLADGTAQEAGTPLPDSSAPTDSGTLTPGETADASIIDAGPDAAPDADADAAKDADANVVCNCNVPKGWTAVTTGSKACAAAIQHLISAPTPGTGACGCDVSNTNKVSPSCANGTLSFKTDNTPSAVCGGDGVSVAVTGSGQCVTTAPGIVLAEHTRFNTLPATGGSCVATPSFLVNNVAATPVDLCLATGSCPQVFCPELAPPGERACIVTEGDEACPDGPFTKKTALGEGFDLSCSACTCAATATCTNATTTFYKNSACTTLVITTPANTCVPSASSTGTDIQSIRYTVTTTPSYTATGPKTPTVTLVKPHTLCCVP